MSKKLILYVSYGARQDGTPVTGNSYVEVKLVEWLFPIICHNRIISELEEEHFIKEINITSILRSYRNE